MQMEFNNVDKAFLDERSAMPGDEYIVTPYGDTRKASKGKLYYAMDIAKGVRGAALKTVHGGGGLILSVLETMDLVSDGSVEEFSREYEEYMRNLPPETMLGKFVQNVGPYIFVGGAALKLFGTALRGTRLAKPLYKAMLAEPVTVAIVSVPDDSNVVTEVMELFGADRKKGIQFGDTTFGRSYFAQAIESGLNYVAAPAEGEAEEVMLKQKFKNALGDFPAAYAIEKFFDAFRASKNSEYSKRRLVINEMLIASKEDADMPKYKPIDEDDVVIEFPNANQFMTNKETVGTRSVEGTPVVPDNTQTVEEVVNE